MQRGAERWACWPEPASWDLQASSFYPTSEQKKKKKEKKMGGGGGRIGNPE
jgi:hypothetical protein